MIAFDKNMDEQLITVAVEETGYVSKQFWTPGEQAVPFSTFGQCENFQKITPFAGQVAPSTS